ncbi:unnamed protein product [Arctogadus glacialis]
MALNAQVPRSEGGRLRGLVVCEHSLPQRRSPALPPTCAILGSPSDEQRASGSPSPTRPRVREAGCWSRSLTLRSLDPSPEEEDDERDIKRLSELQALYSK